MVFAQVQFGFRSLANHRLNSWICGRRKHSNIESRLQSTRQKLYLFSYWLLRWASSSSSSCRLRSWYSDSSNLHYSLVDKLLSPLDIVGLWKNVVFLRSTCNRCFRCNAIRFSPVMLLYSYCTVLFTIVLSLATPHLCCSCFSWYSLASRVSSRVNKA